MGYQTVLLVDDDEDDQELFLAAMQEVAGSVVCHTAVNGRAALDKLLTREVRPDLIFLDLNMPIMGGQKLLQHLKEDPSLHEIPVIIFSTSAHPQTIEQTRQLGAADFITKPDQFSQLRILLRRLFSDSH